MLHDKTMTINRHTSHKALFFAMSTAIIISLFSITSIAMANTVETKQQGGFARGSETIPLEKRSGYVPTPLGERSEAYDFTRTGPNHLRRMSKTEPLAAEPQIIKVLPADPKAEQQKIKELPSERKAKPQRIKELPSEPKAEPQITKVPPSESKKVEPGK